MTSRFPIEGSGKGDSYRDVDRKKYNESWDRIFGKKKKKEKDDNNNEQTENKEQI